MTRNTVRRLLRKWHIWIGWLVGVPLLFWTLSGFFMVLKPIEEVRGTNQLAPDAPVVMARQPVAPPVAGLPVASMELQQRSGGPVWVVALEDGTSRAADPATGRWLPAYGAADAAAEVAARYTGSSSVARTTAVDGDDPPMDWRRPVDAWNVEMADGTRFYVERATGRIAAVRTDWWRAFDFMWGLHIMDLQTREHISNNWVRIFSLIAVVSVVMALVLLPLAQWRSRRR